MILAAYSFLNVSMTIAGPNLLALLGAGAGTAEEGIEAEFNEDSNLMTVGADGTTMNSLNANLSGIMRVRLLKTSRLNGILSQAWSSQRSSSQLWGQNRIVIADPTRGDLIYGDGCAFKRHSPVRFQKVGGMNEWNFDVAQLTPLLGLGTPSAT